MNNEVQIQNHEDSEIGIVDIINFILPYKKWFLVGAILGSVVALGATMSFGKYEAAATMKSISGIDYLTWSRLRRDLPILAYTISLPITDNNYIKTLSSELWWQTNVIPTYSFSKEDSKLLFAITKEIQDSESTNIKNFVVKASGSSKEIALANLDAATSFFRSGGIYLALKDLISNLNTELKISDLEIEKNILASEIEFKYLNQRAENLESLKARFHGGGVAVNSQVVDLKDSSAKFLPINTQLIAANQDVLTQKEQLARLKEKKQQLLVVSRFLTQARPLIDKNYDGILVLEEFERIEGNLRKEISPSDFVGLATFSNIKYSISVIHNRYIEGLEKPTFISTSTPKYQKNVSIGFFGGFLVSIVSAFFNALWLRYRKDSQRKLLNAA